MPSQQLELGYIVIEALTESVYSIVAIQAGCTIGKEVRLGKDRVYLTVAGIA